MTTSNLSASIPLRSVPDRLRQVALFELGGLVLITPPFALLSGLPLTDSLGLIALIALIAALWNAGYCSGFDWLERRFAARRADQRPLRLRAVHAIGFELGLLVMSLPVIVWWTGMAWLVALVADIALAITYVGYAFFFNLAYDRRFPVGGRACPGDGNAS